MIDDIDDLLTSILDDSKPLPVKPSAAQVTVAVARNSGNTKAEADLAMNDPETWLEALMNDSMPYKPGEAAVIVEQITGQKPKPPVIAKEEFNKLEDAHVEKAMTGASHSSVKSDADLLADIMSGNDPELALQTPQSGEEEPGEVVAELQASAGSEVFTDTEQRSATQLKPLVMPTFTPNDFAETIDIRNFATLVTLNTARWHAKVKDRNSTKDVALANEAQAEAFEIRKHLLGGANDKLKAIHRSIDEARAAHYEMTVPWSTTSMQDQGRRVGGRLLPNTLFVEYTTMMAKKRQAMKTALDVFEPEYPALVEAAKKKLGKRFDAREYPNVSSIRAHFDLSFDFQPIPKGDDFKGLPQAQLDALARKANDNMQTMAENAMQDVWCRLYEVVGRMAERLSSPDKTFHDSLVSNVKDTARLARHLNVTKDKKVDDICQKIDDYLIKFEPKDLRKNATLRTTVGAHATSIIQEMNK